MNQYKNRQIAVISPSLLGAIWKIAAFACYAAINTLTRYLSGGSSSQLEQMLPVNVIIFFQDSFAFLFFIPWLFRENLFFYKTQFLKLHFARVLFSLSAITSWSFALFFIPQAEATALSTVGPLIGVAGAKWFLKERISIKRYLLIFMSFTLSVSVAWRFMPSINLVAVRNLNYSYGLICITLSMFLFAAAKLSTRALGTLGESPKKLTGYLLTLMVPFSFFPALYFWKFPLMVHMPWLILGGALTALAIYSVSKALSYAEISFLAPFDFIQFILNTVMGYWIFTEIPSKWALWILSIILCTNLTLLIFKFQRTREIRIS